MVSKGLPSQQVLNAELTKERGEPVVQIEVLPVQVEEVTITFVSTSGSWRQGIWIATEGTLEIAGIRADQFEVWTHTAPRSLHVRVITSADGQLRLYNVWDSGRGRKRESQSATSGMLKEVRSDGVIVYRCNDIGRNPQFDKLVFEVKMAGRPT